MLSYQGRLVLVNSVFTAMPTFYMCSLILPPQVIKQIDRYRKHCLWSEGDINKKGSCLAGQEPACRPETERGLGIVNIQTQKKTLLLKFMDKFYNHADVPSISLAWSKLYSTNVPTHARCPVRSFWWKDVLKLYPDFTSWQHANPTQVAPSSFGLIIGLNPVSETYSHISFPLPEHRKAPLDSSCTMKSIRFLLFYSQSKPLKNLRPFNSFCRVGLGTRIFQTAGSTIGTLGNSALRKLTFSFQALGSLPLFSWLWSSGNFGKHNFFFWLLLKDCSNTRNLLRRKNKVLEDYSCAIGNSGTEETCMHLFFECPFIIACWNSLDIHWNLNIPPMDMVIEARLDIGRSYFREIIIATCWIIWTSGNRLIFYNIPCTVNKWKEHFKNEISLV